MAFQFEAPPSRLTASIADMIARGGSSQAQAIRQIAEAQAQAAQIRGRALGGAIENVGQVVGSIPAQMQQQKIQDQNTQIRQAQLDQVAKTGANEKALTSALQSPSRAKALKSLEGNPEAYQRAVTHYENIDNNMKRLLGSVAAGVREFGDSPEAALAGLGDLVDQGFDAQKLNQYRMQIIQHPEAVSQIVNGLLSQSPDPAHKALLPKVAPPPEPFTLGPGQQRFGPDGQPIASVATAPPTAPAGFNLSPGQTRFGPDGKPVASLPAAPTHDPADPLVAIIGADGLPVLVPRSQAVGKRPASTREQGRPVTSGDAGDISELRSSLDDIAVLGKTLGTTGAASKAGTMLPNVVTELTGWGADAKSRQGVIDRVKQVIGKALEGGVLRKEDEVKYVKILPTIGDPPSVAASKLAGLQSAIQKKLQRKIESLADAGYDTSNFAASSPKVYLDDNGNPKQ